MVSNRGPSAYQPNALPLGHTGSLGGRATLQLTYTGGGCKREGGRATLHTLGKGVSREMGAS